MKFEYFAGEQKTSEWFKIRMGKVSASNLGRWMATSKKDGKPLKARLDYEKELMFERTFNTLFEKFTTAAMQEGTDYEAFAREQYAKIKNVPVVEVGCWYNDVFVASPDGGVKDEGLVEIKWLKDTNFTEVLSGGVIEDHLKQIQGQLFASGRQWCDYVVGNFNTKKIKIIRVMPDTTFFKELEESLKEPLSVKEFDTTNVFDFQLPDGAVPMLEQTNSFEGF